MTPEELKYAIPIFRDGNIYMVDKGIEHCIMHGNEKIFIDESVRQICQKINPLSVIEFGFGFGFTADEFQRQGVQTHIIYEPNDIIYQNALAWAEGKSGVTIINSRYEDQPIDTRVDLVYNDIYGMCDENYAMGSFDDIKNMFDFIWYAEFCSNYVEGVDLPEDYIHFEIGGYSKTQPLIRK